jgi:hypothetical protein
MVEVMIRLQKGLCAVAALGDGELTEAARRTSAEALERARKALSSHEDVGRVEVAARWTKGMALTSRSPQGLVSEQKSRDSREKKHGR